MIHNAHVITFLEWRCYSAARTGRMFAQALHAHWHAQECAAADGRLH